MMEKQYLNDTELMRFIEDTEQKLPCRAPDYLKEQILKKTACRSAETTRASFWMFSAKVLATAAASIAFLLVMPSAAPEDFPQNTASAQEDTLLDLWNQKSNQFCNFLSETTNSIFLKGDD